MIDISNVKHLICSNKTDENLIDEFVEKSLTQKFKMTIVSDKTEHGTMLLKAF